MLIYLVRRIVFGAAVLVGTSLITFLIAFVVPADPAIAMAGAKADPQTLASIRRELRLDQPLYVQYSRVLHTSLSDAFDQDYVRTARGKGLSPARVMLRHAMANALLPLVTLAGLDLAGLLSGVVLTETVFNWPGIGRLAAEAIFNLDIPVIMGTVLFSAFLIVVINLLVDLLYAYLDPRIRLAEA